MGRKPTKVGKGTTVKDLRDRSPILKENLGSGYIEVRQSIQVVGVVQVSS